MAPPTPLLLTLTSAAICMLKATFLPDLFPGIKLTTFFLLTAAVVFGSWTIWKLFIYPNFASPLRHLPQPKSGIIPGLGPKQLITRREIGELFLKWIVDIPNEGLISFPGIFGTDNLLCTEPSSLAEVLVHKSYDFEKPTELRNFLRIILGDGLIIVEGDMHKFQRKNVAPAFSFRHIKELIPLFWKKAREMADEITAEIKNHPEPVAGEKSSGNPTGVVEVNHWANKVTMDIIGVAGLGRDFNSLHNTDDELVANYEEILEPTAEKAMFFGANLMTSPRFVKMLPWKLNETLSKTMGALRGACQQLLADKKAALAADNKEQTVNILSLLIQSNNFSDEMLIDQLLTFIAAGHETTSSAFTWATHLLAINPSVQSKLREEIRAALPSPSEPWDPSIDTASILENLPYLHGITSEVIRLYPTVPTTMRIAVRPTHIGTQFVPQGTRVFLTPWGVNRSPHLWGPTAGDFAPERWIDADTGRLNNHGGVASNYANLTFLHGPRSCIGERFARSELKALLAVFCGRFDIAMADPAEVPVPAGVITSKPKNGMRLRLKVVEGW
ncbi:putative cytochrome P450 [Drepanopeziza brunnea f. sp. 'multigermtubi' MB_m1]|uniref:Putative cytochrome P450 n=1 Tax=Marssonina brunnea f. sp. multigermtubi (strain MB_m1) TaxID=1072389 RepID=K1X0I9_MARBU|nr:putative cytochrome P450 [Drepanopeziza brunnea f. sp. 'multigermtubi' MB_m1]EKD18502.1 putative cytochrome P450 [Drepanopeziza brunnea f. sp. 'multigermtubi' MB_m1]